MTSISTQFAGSWYPADAAECEREIARFLEELNIRDPLGTAATGGIVPHAGWYFSGSIACNVISFLARGSKPDVVAVFGMHLHPGSPAYILTEGTWDTPFGALRVDRDLAGILAEQYRFKTGMPEIFSRDNTIDLQMPFIRYFFGDVKIIPMGVPPKPQAIEIGKGLALAARDAGLEVKIIGSTDLTHYGVNYGFSPKGSGGDALKWVRDENDRRVIDAMLAMNPEQVIEEGLANSNACCAGAAAAAIAAGSESGARHSSLIAYASSHDKSPGDSFVGYAGIVF